MTTRNMAWISLAIGVAFLVAATANAATFLIDATHNNGSFETPVVGPSWYDGLDGTIYEKWSGAVPTGWSTPGTVILCSNGTAADNTVITASAGSQYAVIVQYVGSYVIMNLAETFQANSTYTLTADIMNAESTPVPSGAQMSMADITGTYRVDLDIATAGTRGVWASRSIVIDTAVSTDFVGRQIAVSLWNPKNTQMGIDNVRLSFEPIPEPATLVLLAPCLIGLLACARRKRK